MQDEISSHECHKEGGDVGRDSDSRSSKITKLLKALDAALEENMTGGNSISEVTLRQCHELRTSLQHSSSSNQTPSMSSPSGANLPKSIPATLITPWTVSSIPKDLPPLPPILDKTLETACFTHSNAGGGKITDLNYEQLEWVGDAYLELTATLLISQTFPAFTPGQASQVRERLVKNAQLSQYARSYNFDKRANLGPNFRVKANDMTKIFGDMFEAYVAAVILSDLENGISKAVEWLKGLWGSTIAKDIAAEERQEFHYRNPMWHLGGTENIETTQPHAPPLSPKDQLQKAIGVKGVRIYYDDLSQTTDRISKLPLFTVGCFLDGWGEKGKQLGHGSALGKKEAGAKAAQMALQSKKMLRIYIEKKRLHDEQMELEKRALEGSEGSLINPPT